MSKKSKNAKEKKKKERTLASFLYYPTITPFPTITHVENENLILTEDYFDSLYSDCGKRCCIRRFTWKNHNNIQVQVINYGATITSIKLPSLDGAINDIVVGFDDVKNYEYYKNHHVGAVIGRVCTKIRDNSFSIDGKDFELPKTNNACKAEFEGVIWKTYVDNSKVIMSYIFADMVSGYPGDLLVTITFELSTKNDFTIDIEAFTNKPTIVDISNNVYFNLCSHGSGTEHLNKHHLTLNASTFTSKDKDGIPSGKIVNVLNTKYDFQVPKKLQHLIPVINTTQNTVNQNLCVNEGNGEERFVARVWHVSSGRMLEIYSNQPGVNLSILGELKHSRQTNNNLKELALLDDEYLEEGQCRLKEQFYLLSKFHEHMLKTLNLKNAKDVSDIKKVFRYMVKELSIRHAPTPYNTPVVSSFFEFSKPLIIEASNAFNSTLSPIEQNFIENVQNFIDSIHSDTDYYVLQEAIKGLIKKNQEKTSFMLKYCTEKNNVLEYRKDEDKMIDASISKEQPPVLGKNEVTYTKYGAVCLRTQNYPNAINVESFPSCVLRPGETYKHTITYKFWLKRSTAKKYWKENILDDQKSICKTVTNTTYSAKHTH